MVSTGAPGIRMCLAAGWWWCLGHLGRQRERIVNWSLSGGEFDLLAGEEIRETKASPSGPWGSDGCLSPLSLQFSTPTFGKACLRYRRRLETLGLNGPLMSMPMVTPGVRRFLVSIVAINPEPSGEDRKCHLLSSWRRSPVQPWRRLLEKLRVLGVLTGKRLLTGQVCCSSCESGGKNSGLKRVYECIEGGLSVGLKGGSVPHRHC